MSGVQDKINEAPGRRPALCTKRLSLGNLEQAPTQREGAHLPTRQPLPLYHQVEEAGPTRPTGPLPLSGR